MDADDVLRSKRRLTARARRDSLLHVVFIQTPFFGRDDHSDDDKSQMEHVRILKTTTTQRTTKQLPFLTDKVVVYFLDEGP